MPQVYQQIVRDAARCQSSQPIEHPRLDQPSVCRLAFNQMTHACELWVRQILRQLWLYIRPGKIDPTNHPRDNWILIGTTRNPARFLEDMARVHQDRSLNATLLAYRLERRL